MAANIEFKAHLHSPELQRQHAVELAGEPAVLLQKDTFFNVSKGRLKLREFPNATAELIHYFRANDAEVRKSDYVLTPIADAESLAIALDRAVGIRGVVSKRRELWIVEQTRIHFDNVEGLGEFVELEFVLKEGQVEQDGYDFVSQLMRRLDIRPTDVIECAYIDMLESKGNHDIDCTTPQTH